MEEAKKVIKEAETSAIENWKRLTSAIFYAVMSTSMAFLNKALLDSFNFDFPYFIMLAQMVLTILILETLRFFKVLDIPSFTFQRGKIFFIPSLFYAIHSVLSLSALSGMNIAMYTVLKRCGPFVTLILSVVILKKGFPNRILMISVALLTTGCIIASAGDLSFEWQSYTYGIVSVFCQSIYLVTLQKLAVNFSTAETLHLASFNSAPLLLCCTIVIKQEFKQVVLYNKYHDLGFLVIFVLVLIMGCLLNYSLFLCTTLNSALTTAIVGSIKSVVQVFIGIFTFGGASYNIPTMIGVILNLTGGFLYTFTKFQDTRHSHSGDIKRNHSVKDMEEIEKGKHAENVNTIKQHQEEEKSHLEIRHVEHKHLESEN